MDPCPSREQLEQLLAEHLDGPERGRVESHVEKCTACQETLRQLLDGIPGLPSSLPQSDPLENLVRRLKQASPPRSAPPSDPAGRDQPVPVRFPGPPTARAPLGQLLSYHMIELLGSGATGFVFKAYDEDLARLVAVKVLRPEWVASDTGRARFKREAQAAAAVRHDHVVSIHWVVDSTPNFPLPFLVMEYVEGESLAARLRREGPLPPRAAAEFVRQVAEGLAHAHERGLVHRDIKPSNILLDSKSGRVKIADFGLARAVKVTEEAANGRFTQSGNIVGTPPYMSPEQIRFPESPDPRSDLYGLGVVLYELLTGQLPFPGQGFDTLLRVLYEEPRSPLLINENIPRPLATVTLTCLLKEPARRYRSARELAVDLERWLAGEAIRARPPGPLGQIGRWCRGNPALAAAWTLTAGTLAALVALALCFTSFQTTATNQLRQTQEQTEAVGKENQRLRATLALDRGLALCEKGEAGRGLLWLARSVELAPPDADALQWAVRTQLAAWRPQVHALRATLAHEGAVYAVTFSPDGKTLLTGSEVGTIRLWDMATGRLIRPVLVNGKNAVNALAFGPDGRTVIAPVQDEYIRPWDLARGEWTEPHIQLPQPVLALAVRPDGQALLTGSKDRNAGLWRLGDGKRIRSFAHSGPVGAVAFSPGGRKVLMGSEDGTARLWDADSGELVHSPFVHDDPVTAVAFRPDGRLIATGSKDKSARLWDVKTGRPAGRPLLHRNKVYAVAFSPDGRALLTGSRDHTARLWEPSTGRTLGSPLVHPGSVFAVAFSPDGRTIATAGEDRTARLWDVAVNRPREIALGHEGWVVGVAFRPDGRTFLTAGWDGTVRMGDVGGGKALPPTYRQNAEILAIALSRDGRNLLAGSNDKVARLLDAAMGSLVGVPFRHQEWVLAVAFSPDGRTVLTGSHDRTARLWDVATGQPIGPPLNHREAVTAVAFSPDGRTILTGCWDATAQLWDPATGTPLGEPLPHHGPVSAVAFSPDGRTFLTADLHATARVWDTAARKPIGRLLQHDQAILTAAFSPDGRLVATGGEDRTARLWNAATGRPLGPPLAHPDAVRALAFSPDGRLLLTAGEPHTARLWNVPTPVQGEAERIVRWAEVLTTQTLDADSILRSLDATTWQKRRQGLDELGGPPGP